MNRHFRVPPEHQVFWQDIKRAGKVYLLVIGLVVLTFGTIIYFMTK